MDCTKENHESGRKNNKQRTVSQFGEQQITQQSGNYNNNNTVAAIIITTTTCPE